MGGTASDISALSVSERIRCTLEELGPTFIKIGQVLSGRTDLLPAEYIQELTKLLDAAPTVPTTQVEARIEEELDDSAVYAGRSVIRRSR